MTKKVLVVEDNDVNRKLVVDIIIYRGIDVIEAKDAITAMQLTSQHVPDMVLMDIQLQGSISGLEAVRQIKANPHTKHIPIIAITAFAMHGDRENMLAAGCQEYVAKPFTMQQLSDILEKYLGKTEGSASGS